MLADKKVLNSNVIFLSSLTSFMVFCYLYFRYNWNNLLAIVLCVALAGAIGFIWDRGIKMAGDGQKGLALTLSGHLWWVVVFINIFLVNWLIARDWAYFSLPGLVTITLAVAILLGYLAWIEATYRKKGRSILFGVSAFLWLFVAFVTFAQALSSGKSLYQPPAHSSAANILLVFAFLGFYIFPFIWFFVDTLRKKDTLRALVLARAVEHSQPVLDEAEKALRGLSSKFEEDRVAAVKVLGKLPDSNDRVVKALISATNDEYPNVKRVAREALEAPQHQVFMKTRPEYQKYIKEA